MASQRDIERLYSCPICLDIYNNPVRTECGHSMCCACYEKYKYEGSTQCPVCRSLLTNNIVKDEELSQKIKTVTGLCQHCNSTMVLSILKTHLDLCPRKKTPLQMSKPVGVSSQATPCDVPNRSTFPCPYCSDQNFDLGSLIKHCNEKHKNAPQKLVCPVCVAMPWGDPNLKSANLLQHLNRRHKFEYDTYVDYNVGEEAMMQAALEASLKEK